ncbi:MAG: hypothetical protein JJ895_00645 [Balneolaceae bacterium]|nr:hypothetical protein [Balneolaceae bacterium]
MNEEIIENINARLDRAIDKGRVLLADEELQQQVEELKVKAETTIRKHPIKSVLAGLAVGLIVGAIFSSDD